MTLNPKLGQKGLPILDAKKKEEIKANKDNVAFTVFYPAK